MISPSVPISGGLESTIQELFTFLTSFMKADRVNSNFSSNTIDLITGLLLALCIPGLALSQDESGNFNEARAGQYYLADTFQDWQKLCLAKAQGEHPCHMYQLIKDENGHPTSEFVLFKLNDEEGVAAAATILTPLETLLPSGLAYSIDDEDSVEYPFSWCDRRGCYARIAFTDDDVFSMKKGRNGLIRIESISAPGKPVLLNVSFSGFTAAFGSLDE
jgi:invasion protein IalB